MHRLSENIYVVPGATQKIGHAIASRFQTEGGHVIVTDRDAVAGTAVPAEIGGRFIRLGVGEEADWLQLADLVPTADVVTDSARITGFEDGRVVHDPEHARLENWRAVPRSNLNETFLGCRSAIRPMKAVRRGSIMNISSRSGLVGIPRAAAYRS